MRQESEPALKSFFVHSVPIPHFFDFPLLMFFWSDGISIYNVPTRRHRPPEGHKMQKIRLGLLELLLLLLLLCKFKTRRISAMHDGELQGSVSPDGVFNLSPDPKLTWRRNPSTYLTPISQFSKGSAVRRWPCIYGQRRIMDVDAWANLISAAYSPFGRRPGSAMTTHVAHQYQYQYQQQQQRWLLDFTADQQPRIYYMSGPDGASDAVAVTGPIWISNVIVRPSAFWRRRRNGAPYVRRSIFCSCSRCATRCEFLAD